MALPGNPRQHARDIADGYIVFGKAACLQLSPEELRSLYRLLEQAAREIRAEQVPLEDVPGIQRKNLRLSRANNALALMRNHAKLRRLPL
jgi:hypothetical protein